MKYHERIDGLRFVAIFLVLGDHFATFFFHRISAGYYGVELFFVISGYLITTILMGTRGTPLGKSYLNFMGRRTLRIFPIYYLTLAVLWLIGEPVVREHVLSTFTYTFNYASEYYHLRDTPLDHTWSLCVEEQYYLFWPVIALTLRNYPRVLMGIMLAIVSLGFAQLAFGIFPALTLYDHVGLLSRIPALGIGSIGAIVVLHYELPEWFFKSLVVELIMLASLALLLVTDIALKPILLALISLFLVLKASKYEFALGFISRFLRHRWVVYIGTISYGIYLYHRALTYYVSKYLFEPIWATIPFESWGRWAALKYHREFIQFPLYTALTLVVAALSFRYLEKPILKLKDKLFRKDDQPARSSKPLA